MLIVNQSGTKTYIIEKAISISVTQEEDKDNPENKAWGIRIAYALDINDSTSELLALYNTLEEATNKYSEFLSSYGRGIDRLYSFVENKAPEFNTDQFFESIQNGTWGIINAHKNQ